MVTGVNLHEQQRPHTVVCVWAYYSLCTGVLCRYGVRSWNFCGHHNGNRQTNSLSTKCELRRSDMDVERLNRIIGLIVKAKPGLFMMTEIALDRSCGTAACVAGWTIIDEIVQHSNPVSEETIWELTQDRYMPGQLTNPDYSNSQAENMMGYAQSLLGLDKHEVGKLFQMNDICSNSFRRLCQSYGIDPGSKYMPLIVFDELPALVRQRSAINVLTILRDTGEVKWMEAISNALEEYKRNNSGSNIVDAQ